MARSSNFQGEANAHFLPPADAHVSVADVSYMENTSIIRENAAGCHIDSISNVDDLTKCELLEKRWSFPRDFNLPFSTHKRKGNMNNIHEPILFG